jgi:hypothetical protein
MATRKSSSGAAAKGEAKIEKVMHEHKEGTLRSSSGAKVTSRKQAVAIALSEAREAGAKIPKKPAAKKSTKS